MSEFRAFLALISYPAVFIFVPEPVSYRWVRKHGLLTLPPDINEKSERNGRYSYAFVYGLLLLFLRFLAGRSLWQAVSIVPRVYPWLSPAVSGIAGGILIFGLRRWLVFTSESLSSSEASDALLRGSAMSWLAIFVLGSFTEEFWRAFCIIAFQQNGYGMIPSDLVTAFCFSFAHLSGRPSRIPPGLGNLASEMMIGLSFGALFMWSGSVVSAWLANFVYYTLNFVWLRRRYRHSMQPS